MNLKINWNHKRAKHAIERMWLRGISRKDIVNAIQRGQKRIQKKTNLIEAFHSYYSVVYSEYFFKKNEIHKVYPVTVKIW
ncbi:DUF4258 domain-containing protein [Candidatus Woesearchaeota archaeon]|nr:DUF4258 domain-containing protein [Candidatus Woesearchaeota archaeon]